MRPARVLIVAPWGERAGGAEQMLSTILRHLDRTKLEPAVVFLSAGPFADEVSSLGIRTWTVPAGRLRQPVRYASTIRALARVIRRHQPDIVLAWSAKTHLYLGLANLLIPPRRPALWWQHDIPVGHWIDRLATLLPASAIGCSSHASERAQLQLRPRRRTFVVHPGVDMTEASQSVTRRSLGIPEDAWVVGSVGRLQPWKGHDRVITAVSDLRRRDVPAVALIVGGESFGLSPGYGEELRALARTAGVEGQTVFTGHVADVRHYYELMDVFVNASDREPFGIALVEAMAAGRTVVALRLGGPVEIIEHGISGLLVEESGLADVLLTIASDQVLARRLGEDGARRARHLFTPDVAVAAFTTALTNLARQATSEWPNT